MDEKIETLTEYIKEVNRCTLLGVEESDLGNIVIEYRGRFNWKEVAKRTGYDYRIGVSSVIPTEDGVKIHIQEHMIEEI